MQEYQEQLNVFSEEILSQVILHIPHSGTYLPNFEISAEKYAQVKEESKRVCDSYLPELYSDVDVTKIIFPLSRMFCDVERLSDDKEEMFAFGRGKLYTRLEDGTPFRKVTPALQKVVESIYSQHHAEVAEEVSKKLVEFNSCYLIDCHSFNDTPLQFDLDKTLPRPDICIGTDENTPEFLADYVENFFTIEGYVVKRNSPYAGCFTPSGYRKDQRVKSLMIEINKKLYCHEDYSYDFVKGHKLSMRLSRLFSF